MESEESKNRVGHLLGLLLVGRLSKIAVGLQTVALLYRTLDGGYSNLATTIAEFSSTLKVILLWDIHIVPVLWILRLLFSM